MKTNLLLLGSVLFMLSLIGCEGPEGDVGPQGPAAPYLTVEPSTATVRVGEFQQFTVTTSDRQETYTWRTSNPSIATVDQTGMVAGVSPGIVFINVTGNESNASKDITVTVEQALASEVSFSQHILPMFTTPNFWYSGANACTNCHFAVSDESAHEIDLTSWDGLMKGADSLEDPPGESLLGESSPGAGDFDWEHSELRARLRDNRMPEMPGWTFFRDESNRNGPDLTEDPSNPGHLVPKRWSYTSWDNEDNVPNALGLIQAWVEAGVPNNPNTFTYQGTGFSFTSLDFATDIQPLFIRSNMWFQDSQACTGCHFAISDNSAHQMDLSSHAGMMIGIDSLEDPPGESLFGESAPGAGDFDWQNSELRHRLRDNRMPPPAWPFFLDESNRDGPTITDPTTGLPIRAVDLIGKWIADGAKNN
ncbi:MAG: Ig-like domain-containing protein [bacterium]